MADSTSSIQQLYVAYFSRPADPEGLAYWNNVVATNPTTGMGMISANFANTTEYKNTYAGMDNTAVVNAVYKNLFGRTGEKAGVDFWVNALNNQSVTIDNVVKAFVDGALGDDKAVFAGRVAVAKSFTEHLDLPAEATAYNTTAGQAAAKAYIGGIVDLTTAAGAIDPGAIDMKIADIVGTKSGLAPTEFFVG